MFKHNSWIQDNNTEKLKTKDLITIGILDAIFVVIYFLVGMILMITPVTFLFITTVAAVPSGVIFMLMLAKVPKAGVLSISGIVLGLVFLLSGHFWLMVVLSVAGGILADVVVYCLGDRRSFATMTLAFTIFMLIFTIGAYSPMLLFTDAFLAAKSGGHSATMFTELISSYLTWPVLGLVLTGTAVGSVVGAYMGKMLLNKHFVKAGIV